MSVEFIVKLAIIAVLGLFALYCVFNAFRHGFRAFIGCLVLVAIGFVLAVYFVNNELFLQYWERLIAFLG